MKIKKYIRKMAEYLGVERDECSTRKACIKKVLKKLKKREHRLRDDLEETKNSKQRKKLKEEIEIVHQQRKKGIKALRELRK